MIKDKAVINNAQVSKKVIAKRVMGNPLKYDNYISPISDSLKRDLDEALKDAHNPKSKKYTSAEIFAQFGL